MKFPLLSLSFCLPVSLSLFLALSLSASLIKHYPPPSQRLALRCSRSVRTPSPPTRQTGTHGYSNCYTGTSWDPKFCPDPVTCASNCALEGNTLANYEETYEITTNGNMLKLVRNLTLVYLKPT